MRANNCAANENSLKQNKNVRHQTQIAKISIRHAKKRKNQYTQLIVTLRYTECTNVLMDCCVNFGSQTSARCCDKDFLSNTDIGQPTAQNRAYIPSTGLFEV